MAAEASTTQPLYRALGALQVGAAIVLLALIGLLLAGTLPSLVGNESYVVLSGSMEPTIHVGDIAVVQPVRVGDLQVGDVITYRTPQQPDVIVTHRLRAINQEADGKLTFETRGDANNVSDSVPVEGGAVLGKVIYWVPRAGYLVDFSKRSEGKVLLLGIPGVLLAADYLRSRLRKSGGAKAAKDPAFTPLAGESARIEALLDRGRQALAGGQHGLAMQAADGVLESEPRNEDAWLLKAEATTDVGARIALLQTALVVNPKAERVTAALKLLQAGVAAA